MQTGATVDPWAVAVFDDRCFDGQRIGQQLAECCHKRGMVILATFYIHALWHDMWTEDIIHSVGCSACHVPVHASCIELSSLLSFEM
jgi:hypothetical protein